MMEDDNQQLLQPFISSSTSTADAAAVDVISTTSPAIAGIIFSSSSSATTTNSYGIILRVAFVVSIGVISIWANHEASKGFSISIINGPGRDKPAGKRFDLFYLSNDEASRLVLSTSKFVEDFLYPSLNYPKKQVSHVVLWLSSQNLSQPVIVDSGEVNDQFVIYISPSVLEGIDFKRAIYVAMQKGMVRLWLWDGFGNGNAPSNLVNGIVEFVSQQAFSGGRFRQPDSGSSDLEYSSELEEGLKNDCWRSKNPKAMARFLSYCEMKKPGFIRRLNRGMRNGWHDQMLDDALLGLHVRAPCHSHHNS
ncbi:OLC1v1023533C1 [Oldenlandia corymbosa var. corymbosa]|uniref:OLC1v1023533C1 n=1 Tax=Oldenlandia corymbosa var. corymbosa TaxID=529605 RepID=A0AAV1C1K5_OLDCO|nr:OLC1v1023533C1 [Oldenlandia corymbosa var. corymbosa]